MVLPGTAENIPLLEEWEAIFTRWKWNLFGSEGKWAHKLSFVRGIKGGAASSARLLNKGNVSSSKGFHFLFVSVGETFNNKSPLPPCQGDSLKSNWCGSKVSSQVVCHLAKVRSSLEGLLFVKQSLSTYRILVDAFSCQTFCQSVLFYCLLCWAGLHPEILPMFWSPWKKDASKILCPPLPQLIFPLHFGILILLILVPKWNFWKLVRRKP